MVVTEERPMTAAQKLQNEARRRYLQSLAEHKPLTGVALGAEFGRTDRWGQKRIEEVTKTHLIPNASSEGSQGRLGDDLSLPPVTPPISDSEPSPIPQGRMSKLKARFARKRPPRPAPVRPVVPGRSGAAVAPRSSSPQRRGASGVAWLAFGLGIVISVGANVGHIWFVSKPSAEALIAAMVFAAFWPVALAVSVEVLSRVTWPAALRWPGLLGTVLVGGVALVVSYRHMNGLLLYFGESTLSASLGPIGVDGLLIVGGFAILAIGETKKRAR